MYYVSFLRGCMLGQYCGVQLKYHMITLCFASLEPGKITSEGVVPFVFLSAMTEIACIPILMNNDVDGK